MSKERSTCKFAAKSIPAKISRMDEHATDPQFGRMSKPPDLFLWKILITEERPGVDFLEIGASTRSRPSSHRRKIK